MELVSAISALLINITNGSNVKERFRCERDYREFVSVKGRFCIERNKSDFDDVPIDLITDGYNNLRYKDIKCILRKINIGQQLGLRSAALGYKVGDESSLLGEVWPLAKEIKSSWGEIAEILCDGVSCKWDRNKLDWHWVSKRVGWSVPFLVSSNNMYEDWLKSRKENEVINLGYLPVKWLQNENLGSLVERYNLEDKLVESIGHLYPTAGQTGDKLYAMQLVQGVQGNQTAKGQLRLRLINVNESDKTPPQDRKGKGEIITGTNRAIKEYCNGTDWSRGYSPCAYIVTEDTSKKFYILVNGTLEKLNLRDGGGGDLIVINSEVVPNSIRQVSGGWNIRWPRDINNGDFRSDEIVGATNDIPNIRRIKDGDIDGCNRNIRATILPIYHSQARVKIGAYRTRPCIPIRQPNVKYVKQVIGFRTGEGDVAYLHQIERKCEIRQLYKIEPCVDRPSAECAFPSEDWRVTICRGIDKLSESAKGQQIKYGEIFPWTMRSDIPRVKSGK